MRMYSAGEAIGPAWEHTKALMWQDRRWGRLLKLSLLAFGAELGTSFNFNVRGLTGHHGLNPALVAVLMGVGAFFLLFSLLLFVLFLYLGSRLQLAQFDVLVLRDPTVGPAWERHGRHTWRWAGIKVAIMVGVVVVLLPLLIPAIPIFVAFAKAATPVAGTTPGQFPTIHWAAFGIAFVEVLAIVVVAVMLIRFVTSLVLPGVALEDLGYADAFQRAWDLFRSDVAGMLWFALLQPLLMILIGLGMGVGMLLLLALLLLPFGLLAFLIWHLTHGAGSMAWFLLGIVGVLAFLIAGTVSLCVYLATGGTLLMFARAWSLYFLGGRYPLLGQYLEPSPAVPVWTPPPSLPRDDDEPGGPDFPADPVLA